MRYGSVCSGIEAATMAWHPLGWDPMFFSEIEPFPCSVLAHHYPDVPNHGDMTKFAEWPDHAIDLLVGGTPCQSFSIAGLRAGLADPRGNLMLTYLALAARRCPQWLVWGNVPGVLSSNRGRDFGTFLRGLAELGYGFAYRVLDAQFVRTRGFEHAVPQRRRRVFVVGYFGDWRPAAAVLFDSQSLRGDPPPRRETRQVTSGTLSSRTTGGGGLVTDFELAGGLVTEAVADTLSVGANQTTGFASPSVVASTGDVAHCLNAGGMGRQDYETETMVAHTLLGKANSSHAADQETYVAQSTVWSIMPQNSGKDYKARSVDVAQPLMATGPTTGNQGGDYVQQPISFGAQMSVPQVDVGVNQTLQAKNPMAVAFGGDVSRTLSARYDSSPCADRGMDVVSQHMAVRRLTPTECERLQGFPDNFTLVPHRNKPAADGPRYKALGNSMAVNVMRWIGERIDMVDKKLATSLNEEAA